MGTKITSFEKDTSTAYIHNAWWVELEKDTGERKLFSVRAEAEPTLEDVRGCLLKSMEFLEINYFLGFDERDMGIDDYKKELRSWLPD